MVGLGPHRGRRCSTTASPRRTTWARVGSRKLRPDDQHLGSRASRCLSSFSSHSLCGGNTSSELSQSARGPSARLSGSGPDSRVRYWVPRFYRTLTSAECRAREATASYASADFRRPRCWGRRPATTVLEASEELGRQPPFTGLPRIAPDCVRLSRWLPNDPPKWWTLLRLGLDGIQEVTGSIPVSSTGFFRFWQPVGGWLLATSARRWALG